MHLKVLGVVTTRQLFQPIGSHRLTKGVAYASYFISFICECKQTAKGSTGIRKVYCQ